MAHQGIYASHHGTTLARRDTTLSRSNEQAVQKLLGSTALVHGPVHGSMYQSRVGGKEEYVFVDGKTGFAYCVHPKPCFSEDNVGQLALDDTPRSRQRALGDVPHLLIEDGVAGGRRRRRRAGATQ